MEEEIDLRKYIDIAGRDGRLDAHERVIRADVGRLDDARGPAGPFGLPAHRLGALLSYGSLIMRAAGVRARRCAVRPLRRRPISFDTFRGAVLSCYA